MKVKTEEVAVIGTIEGGATYAVMHKFRLDADKRRHTQFYNGLSKKQAKILAACLEPKCVCSSATYNDAGMCSYCGLQDYRD